MCRMQKPHMHVCLELSYVDSEQVLNLAASSSQLSHIASRDDPLTSLILGHAPPPVVRDFLGQVDMLALRRCEIVWIRAIAVAADTG